MEPIHIPIDGVLDLHTFRPAEVPDLLSDYIEACREAGIFQVRIIHGKGTGTLKRLVHRVLEKHPMVASFTDAPPQAGGWGATLAKLEANLSNT
jgi:DNA-nicking Smr family endonuclease